MQLLWRYNKEAVALRIAFFTSARPGGVAHTVLVRDIPGLELGTLPNRIEDTALRFLPRFIKRRLVVSSCIASLCSSVFYAIQSVHLRAVFFNKSTCSLSYAMHSSPSILYQIAVAPIYHLCSYQ